MTDDAATEVTLTVTADDGVTTRDYTVIFLRGGICQRTAQVRDAIDNYLRSGDRRGLGRRARPEVRIRICPNSGHVALFSFRW